MTAIRLTLCAIVLVALPAFAAETEPDSVAVELPAAPAADLPEAVGCADSRSSVEHFEVEPTQSVFDPVEKLVGPTTDPGLVPESPSLSCGGPFPVYQPGACTQSCAPCYRNSDCPPMFGRPQKCCTYCP